MYEGVKGRKPTHKRVSKESDWKTYYGSNKPTLRTYSNQNQLKILKGVY